MSLERKGTETSLPQMGSVDPPPCRPPLEIVQLDGQWVLEEYQCGARNGETFGTFDGRLDAMQTAQDQMDADSAPCILRWDAEDIVGGLYWNDQFEELAVRFDEMMNAWVIVPVNGHYLFQAGDQHEAVLEYAQAVQRRYDFKRLLLYDAEDEKRQEVDHRFLRHSIADSGVRFDAAKLQSGREIPEPAERTTAGNQPPEISGGRNTADRPTNSLMAIVDGYEQLEVDEETKTLHYYDITWTDGTPARVVALKPDLENQTLVEAFSTARDHWEKIHDEDRIATIYGHGDSPSQWIAYDPGQGSLAAMFDDLEFETRLTIVEDVAEALDTANRNNVPPAGVAPGSVRIGPRDGMAQATLSEWGLGRALLQTIGETPVTWYTAPEQLQGTTAATTGVYQLGALTYWLVLDTVPFVHKTSLDSAIQNGSYRPPSEVKNVPADVDEVLGQAMAAQPYNRYTRGIDFADELREVLETAR